MRKDRLYLLTFLSVALIYPIVAAWASSRFLKESSLELIDAQLEFGRKESRTFAVLVGHGLRNGTPRDSLIAQIQESVLDTDQNNVFISLIDWSGKIICHPEIQKLGQGAAAQHPYISSVADDLSPEEFLEIYKGTDLSETRSEVIFMLPIQNSDWIVVSHLNLERLHASLERLKHRFYTLFALIGLIIIPSFVMATRTLGSRYEKRLELQKQGLEDELLKLNRAVGESRRKLAQHPRDQGTKKRILTQLQNELLSIPIGEIAHIHTENTITYVVGSNGKKSTTNHSLDELFSQLDESLFFRANRQFIISISSIDKIVKYGNNQLKILVNPPTGANILINKNKAAEFKAWLNS